jgi:hypothetical protein
MGIASSKDEAGKAILGSLPPGFLDPKGRALRDELDACLGRSMWFFSLAGVAVALPLCVRYRTERPLMAAAITCPVLDMMYGELIVLFCSFVFVGFGARAVFAFRRGARPR